MTMSIAITRHELYSTVFFEEFSHLILTANPLIWGWNVPILQMKKSKHRRLSDLPKVAKEISGRAITRTLLL